MSVLLIFFPRIYSYFHWFLHFSTLFHLHACSVAQSCPTLCNYMDHGHEGLLYMRFPRKEYWSGLPFPTPGDLPNWGTEPIYPAWQVDSLLLSHLGISISFQLGSVTQSGLTLCSSHGLQHARLPVHHQLPCLLKLTSIESVMPANHLILRHPLSLMPFIFPTIRVFSNESGLCIRWWKYWGFNFSISPSN